MNGSDFASLLEGGPLVADGGMGTALIAAGLPVDSCVELENADHPELVESIHRGFVEAGSRLILTNTFGANRFRLRTHGLEDRLAELNARGVQISRSVGADVVAGSMGPLGVRLAPYGRVPEADAASAYREQAAALRGAGVDLLLIETQTDVRELELAVRAAREAAPDLAIVACATFTTDDRTWLGSTPRVVAEALAELEVDALGANCGEGPAQILRVIEAMAPVAAGAGIPLVARPNAGGPAEVGGRFVYPATPGYVGDVASALVRAGVGIVGGCCGMGPAHAASIVRSLADGPRVAVAGEAPAERAAPARATNTQPETTLERALTDARFVVAVEMEPPRSFDASTLVAAAGTLRDAGATVIDVADSPMARMRMSAWAACRLVQERAGIETVLHFPTRGRNLLRLQGDLLGAHALGIRNLFVCVGDPVTIGEYPQGSNAVDVTATGLLALVTESLNAGADRRGSSIGEPTAFFAGAAVAPTAPDLEREARLLARKVAAGARFLLSQPVFDPGPLAELRAAYERAAGAPLEVPILAGVLPLVSARHAEFLHGEVPGIEVPDDVRTRMRTAGDDPAKEGLAMAADLIAALRDQGEAGVYLMPQFGRYDLAAEAVEAARR